MTVHVTQHAIDRYIERVAPVNRAQAEAVIQSAEKTIELAARFGAHVVRLRTGGKAILTGVDDVRVVTILSNDQVDLATLRSVPRPVCCGLCGLQCSHPIASVCTRTECPLGASRRTINDQGRSSS